MRRIKQDRREKNKLGPATTRRRTPKWAPLADRIRELIRQHPDLTLRELKAERQTNLSVQTLCTALQKLKLPLKKSPDRFRASAARCGTGTFGVAEVAVTA